MSERETPAVVLYIEDHPVNIRLMHGVFALWPHLVLDSVATATAGLEHIRRRRPDLVLVDGNVVELDGIDVVRRICGLPATGDMSVMVISSDSRPARAVELLALGVDEYLVKPFDIGHLGEVIGRLTRSRGAAPAAGAVEAIGTRSMLGGL